jgi:tricorn protease
MKNFNLSFKLLLAVLLTLPFTGFAIDTKDTRMLSQPAISAGHIAFIYAEDLWVANIDGSQPRRLTVDEGIESNPVFSPDGKLIAFSAQYDGNTDVFVIPIEGGIPKRLTWHPAADIVRGFTPDGKSILFVSQRTIFTNRYLQLFTVPVTGGHETMLEIPNAYHAKYSPDGKWIAYTPIPDAFRQWKHYRGGMISNIMLFSFADKSVVKISQPDGGCNDTQPVWLGDKIYFRSDRNGEFNLFSYDISSKEIKQLTDYKDFPIINASGGDEKIIFEQAGYLHIFEPGTSSAKKLTIGIAADLLELRPRFVKGGNYIRWADISPSGSRIVYDYRGEIITAPAEKGDYRNLTRTTGVHEKFPAWSPDGRSIAYFSDASGEYQLYIKAQDGKGEPKIFSLKGAGFYAYLKWSPDSKKINFVDNSRSLYVLDIASGAMTKIDADELYTPGEFRDISGNWSADSKWIAYTRITSTQFKQVYLYSVAQQKSFAVTDGLSDASEPRFSRDGKYLYFFSSTDAGPVINWFDQSSIDFRKTNSIYLVTLQKSTISPFAKESDEETAKSEAGGESKKPAGKKAVPPEENKELSIDWDGLQNRIIDIPVKAGNYAQLNVDNNGDLLYVSSDDGGPGMMHKYNFKKRADSEVIGMDGYLLTADGKKRL